MQWILVNWQFEERHRHYQCYIYLYKNNSLNLTRLWFYFRKQTFDDTKRSTLLIFFGNLNTLWYIEVNNKYVIIYDTYRCFCWAVHAVFLSEDLSQQNFCKTNDFLLEWLRITWIKIHFDSILNATDISRICFEKVFGIGPVIYFIDSPKTFVNG